MRVALAGLCVMLVAAPLAAQSIQLGGLPLAHKQHVELVSDSVQVLAGQPQVVELRFRVQDGFHINSHTPNDQLLIPTVLRLDAGSGVKVEDEQYPKGSKFRLPLNPGDALDVYQGEFRVKVRLLAPKGASTLNGELHYQACDNASCFPPRTLKVMIAVSGE
ncbi:MAG: protein-disulfide reductase DsbD N-terminal domain-containing protein [Acidobacteriaceae bacterium]